MQPPRTFVVRIYRCDTAAIVGVVESVETGATVPFRSAEALLVALGAASSAGRVVPNPRTEETP
jgi:hypothetical protein